MATLGEPKLNNGGSSTSWSCHGYGGSLVLGLCCGCRFVLWCLWVLPWSVIGFMDSWVMSWGLCGGLSALWSCRGCGGSSVSGHAWVWVFMSFIFVVVGWFSWVVVGLILVVVVVGCVKWWLTGGGGGLCAVAVVIVIYYSRYIILL